MNVSPTRRFRCAVGLLDDEFDEDLEIDMSAVSTPSGTSITHHAFPSKRRKINPVGEQVAKSPPSVVSKIEATADCDQKSGVAKPIEEMERNQVRLIMVF